MLKKRLDNPALAAHIIHHGHHVVTGAAHQRWPKHDGQIPGLHLVELGMFDDAAQVLDQVLERLVVCGG